VTLSHTYPRTANDHLKDGFELKLALSFMAAVLLHTLVFELWPAMQVDPWTIATRTTMDVVPVDPIDVPPAPAPLRRPAMPVPTAGAVDVHQTMPSIPWDDVPALPPPPVADPARAGSDAIPFTPYTVEPSLANPAEVERALLREYPVILKDAGIGGTVLLLVHIDALGKVLETRVGGTSGMESLDEAALRVAAVLRFRPALNRDKAVEVWIRLPITFQVRTPRPS